MFLAALGVECQGTVRLTPKVPEVRVSAGVAGSNNLNNGNLGQNFQQEKF
ncbi:hypothetical protein [Marinobacterium sedimentorum]|nr:hypothetical protein [Marinobacterium sedimentorum]MCP8686088.1 hypothetical protein [Marinobacterium sedimentorum]